MFGKMYMKEKNQDIIFNLRSFYINNWLEILSLQK
jgi:hypothetical protein